MPIERFRFSLNGLVILTAAIALALASLGRPSLYWSLAIPPISLVVVVWSVSRAVSLPIERVFWLSFLAGMLTYAIALVGVRMMFFVYDRTMLNWAIYFESFVWASLYGQVPNFNLIINGYSYQDFLSFVICLNLTLAMLLSTITALTAKMFIRAKN